MAADWKRRRIGDFARRKKVVNESGVDLPPLSVTKDYGVILQSEKYNKRVATDPKKYIIVGEGDFAFDPMSLYYGSLGRVVGIEHGLISPDYVAFQVDDSVDPVFVEYALRSPQMIRKYAVVAQAGNQFGKRRRVYWSVLQELELEVPGIEEQRKIAAILSSLDETIEKTEGVINQVEVVKKGLLTELLTTGLPGQHREFTTTPLGRLPASWFCHTIEQLGIPLPANGKSPPTQDQGIPTLSLSAIRGGRVQAEGNTKYVALTATEHARYRLNHGDVLVVRGNANPAFVGKCGLVRDVPDGCIYPDLLMRIRPQGAFVPEFFVELWNHPLVHEQLLLRAKTTNGTLKINQQDVASVLLPVPPESEQQAIARLVGGVDERGRAERLYLAQLQTVRSGLLDALLSGHVDVNVPAQEAA